MLTRFRFFFVSLEFSWGFSVMKNCVRTDSSLFSYSRSNEEHIGEHTLATGVMMLTRFRFFFVSLEFSWGFSVMKTCVRTDSSLFSYSRSNEEHIREHTLATGVMMLTRFRFFFVSLEFSWGFSVMKNCVRTDSSLFSYSRSNEEHIG